MKSRSVTRTICQSAPALILLALAALLTRVNASGNLRDETIARRMPFAVYNRDQLLDKKADSVLLPSRRYGQRIDTTGFYTLPEIDADQLGPTEPNQIGVNREANFDSREVVALINPDGSRLRIIGIKSVGAKALRAHFKSFDVAPGDQVFVHGIDDRRPAAGPYSSNGPFGDGDFWSDIIDGDTLIIEHYTLSRRSRFQISEIAHIYADLADSAFSPQLLSCEEDASCGNEPERNAVGRIVYSRSGGTFVCTGTLLNNRTGDFTPFFLTAAHCVSSETVARTVQTYWLYQTTGCDSGSVRTDSTSSTGGSTLLATSRSSDQTLLRMLGAVPPGLVFSGWDATTRSTGTVYGLHHPGTGVPPSMSSFLRRAAGSISGFLNCPPSGLIDGYQVDWVSGVTEPGSSGSGLFAPGSGLVGVLSCGPSVPSCSDRLALYGRLSDFFPQIQHYLEQGGNCVASLSGSQQTFGATGGSATLSVFAPNTCPWSAQSSVGWMTLAAPAGTGTGSSSYTVLPNTGTTTRVGSIVVQDKFLTITQAGINCRFSLSASSQSFAAAGGPGTVNITVDNACNWLATSNVDWVRITSSPTGSGNGAISYTVSSNLTSAGRSGRVNVGDTFFDVNQESGPVITGVTIDGKQLIIGGANFVDGADLLIDGARQKKTANDPSAPTTRIIARKAAKWIAPGQEVTVQIRNADGKLSQEFRFRRPSPSSVARRLAR